jgi:hypothetical protein
MSVNADVPFHNGLSETSGLMTKREGYFISMGSEVSKELIQDIFGTQR